jgi:hypothetical protein
MNTPRILLLLLIASATGCSKSQESLSSDDQKLVPVYAELLVLREGYQSHALRIDSTAYQQKVDSLLRSIGISQKEFSTRLSEIAGSQKVSQEFHAQVRLELERKKSSPQQ